MYLIEKLSKPSLLELEPKHYSYFLISPFSIQRCLKDSFEFIDPISRIFMGSQNSLHFRQQSKLVENRGHVFPVYGYADWHPDNGQAGRDHFHGENC